MKSGRVVLVLSGRYAGRKAVIVKVCRYNQAPLKKYLKNPLLLRREIIIIFRTLIKPTGGFLGWLRKKTYIIAGKLHKLHNKVNQSVELSVFYLVPKWENFIKF